MAKTDKPTKTDLASDELTDSITIRCTARLREQLRKRAFSDRVDISELARSILHNAVKRVQV